MKMDVAMSSILGEDFSCNVLIFFLVFHGGETINCSLALFVFLFISLLFQQILASFPTQQSQKKESF